LKEILILIHSILIQANSLSNLYLENKENHQIDLKSNMPYISDPFSHCKHFLITVFEGTDILLIDFLEAIDGENPNIEEYLEGDDEVEDDEDGFGGELVGPRGVCQEEQE
jgi:hypothetical protein